MSNATDNNEFVLIWDEDGLEIYPENLLPEARAAHELVGDGKRPDKPGLRYLKSALELPNGSLTPSKNLNLGASSIALKRAVARQTSKRLDG